MPWTFEQRINRKIDRWLDNILIDENACLRQERPLFYNKFPISVGLSPKIENWYIFEELLNELKNTESCALVHGNKRTLSFVCFGYNPKILSDLEKKKKYVSFNFIKWIPQENWVMKNKIRDSKKKTHLYYKKYRFRIKFNKPSQLILDTTDLHRMGGLWMRNPCYPEMFYVEKLSDITMLKILYHDKIQTIDEK